MSDQVYEGLLYLSTSPERTTGSDYKAPQLYLDLLWKPCILLRLILTLNQLKASAPSTDFQWDLGLETGLATPGP